jgi:hypothetical protein
MSHPPRVVERSADLGLDRRSLSAAPADGLRAARRRPKCGGRRTFRTQPIDLADLCERARRVALREKRPRLLEPAPFLGEIRPTRLVDGPWLPAEGQIPKPAGDLEERRVPRGGEEADEPSQRRASSRTRRRA